MNRKQLSILLVLVVVVGVVGALLYKQTSSSWHVEGNGMGQKLLGDFAVNDVASIALVQGTNQINLVKKDDLWRVRERGGYPADYDQISEFLLKAVDLKVIQSEQVGPSQWARLGLALAPGTNPVLTVEFRDKNDKLMKFLQLGKPHMKKSNRSPSEDAEDNGFPDGRYVRVGTNSDTVALISDPLSSLDPKAESWLDKGFFKVEKPRSIAATFPVATNSWKAVRENAEGAAWKLENATAAEHLDGASTAVFSSALAAPAFNDVLPLDTKPEQVGLDNPITLTVATFEQFNYTVKVGSRTNDAYPVALSVTAVLPKERVAGKNEKSEDKTRLDKEFQDTLKKLQEKLAHEKSLEKWTYLVSNWTLDPLLKHRSQLLEGKKGLTNSVASPTVSGGNLPVGEETPLEVPGTNSPGD